MNRARDPFACRVARRWVRMYTARLARDARDCRRAEIDSDLWEHLSDARATNQPRVATQFAVLTRMVVGMPADILWRHRAPHSVNGARSTKQRRFQRIAFLCAVVVVVDVVIASSVDDWSQVSSIWWVLAMPIGLLLVGMIGAVATGLWLRERRTQRST